MGRKRRQTRTLVLLEFNDRVALVRVFCDSCGSVVVEKIISVQECHDADGKAVLCYRCRRFFRAIYKSQFRRRLAEVN